MDKVSEEELAFIEEYKALLDKYNVRLIATPWTDEYGSNIDVTFTSMDRNQIIDYSPKVKIHTTRYCGMGG